MSAPSSSGAEPNLTPILDMVFQLITFFMLVINFKGASMDMSLKLPVLGSARPIPYNAKLEPMVLNIDKEGNVKAYGHAVPDLEKYITTESRMFKQLWHAQGKELKDNEIPVPIVVRADQNVSFRQLNKVIKTCQNHGYRQFQLSAMTRSEKNK